MESDISNTCTPFVLETSEEGDVLILLDVVLTAWLPFPVVIIFIEFELAKEDVVVWAAVGEVLFCVADVEVTEVKVKLPLETAVPPAPVTEILPVVPLPAEAVILVAELTL